MNTHETPSVSDTTERRAPRARRLLEVGLGIACAAVLTAMMFLTGADVIARYVLNAPIKGAFELTEILLVCLVFLSMPLAMLSNAHVEVELWEPGTKAAERFRLLLGGAAALAVLGGLAWQLLEHGERLHRYGSVSNSLEVPLFLVAWLAAAGCALGALIAVFKILSIFGAKE